MAFFPARWFIGNAFHIVTSNRSVIPWRQTVASDRSVRLIVGHFPSRQCSFVGAIHESPLRLLHTTREYLVKVT